MRQSAETLLHTTEIGPFLQAERTGNVALALTAMRPHDKVRGLLLKSTVAGARCMTYLVAGSTDSNEIEEFRHRYTRAVRSLDSVSDPAPRKAGNSPLPSQEVQLRLLLRDDEHARDDLLTVALKQGWKWFARMHDFEAVVPRWTDEHRSLVVRMMMVVEDERDARSLVKLACDLGKWAKERGHGIAMYRHSAEPVYADWPFTFNDICEWLDYDPKVVEAADPFEGKTVPELDEDFDRLDP